jgi:hypothetical protein
MRATVSVTGHGHAPGGHPEAPGVALALNGATGARRRGQLWQAGMGSAGQLCLRRRTVNSIKGGLPQGAPFGILGTAASEPIYFGEIKELRGEPGKAAMGADGAGEGGEGLR